MRKRCDKCLETVFNMSILLWLYFRIFILFHRGQGRQTSRSSAVLQILIFFTFFFSFFFCWGLKVLDQICRMGPDYIDHGHPKESLEIKEEGKFFSRLLSKENSMSNSSYRVLYYGGASGAVPFMWEIQPGTPKHTFSDTCLIPPLTPPPSHHKCSNRSSSHKSMQRLPKPAFLFSVFPRFLPRKALVSLSSTTSSSSSSSPSWSSVSSSMYTPSWPEGNSSAVKSNFRGGCCFRLRPKSALRFGTEDDDIDDRVLNSPTTTLQFSGKSNCRPWTKPGYG